MLYDPKWDVFTIESFAAWLETKPENESYNFTEADNCAAAQYLKAKGIKNYNISVFQLRELGWFDIVNAYPWTFGAASRHAASLLRS